jgi:hypothetical protein
MSLNSNSNINIIIPQIIDIDQWIIGNPPLDTFNYSIKEQKPGIDLYPRITFIQFIICYYLISYYTYMDARGA